MVQWSVHTVLNFWAALHLNWSILSHFTVCWVCVLYRFHFDPNWLTVALWSWCVTTHIYAGTLHVNSRWMTSLWGDFPLNCSRLIAVCLFLQVNNHARYKAELVFLLGCLINTFCFPSESTGSDSAWFLEFWTLGEALQVWWHHSLGWPGKVAPSLCRRCGITHILTSVLGCFRHFDHFVRFVDATYLIVSTPVKIPAFHTGHRESLLHPGSCAGFHNFDCFCLDTLNILHQQDAFARDVFPGHSSV